jgi:hypothetical protein
VKDRPKPDKKTQQKTKKLKTHSVPTKKQQNKWEHSKPKLVVQQIAATEIQNAKISVIGERLRRIKTIVRIKVEIIHAIHQNDKRTNKKEIKKPIAKDFRPSQNAHKMYHICVSAILPFLPEPVS